MSFGEMLQWFDSSGWLGLLGLVLTLVGFAVTARAAIRSRKASEKAETAAKAAVGEVQKVKVVVDLAEALSELEEVKRLVRANDWTRLPERLSKVRRLVIGARSKYPNISPEDDLKITETLVSFAEVEKQSIKFMTGTAKSTLGRMHSVLLREADFLAELVSRLA